MIPFVVRFQVILAVELVTAHIALVRLQPQVSIPVAINTTGTDGTTAQLTHHGWLLGLRFSVHILTVLVRWEVNGFLELPPPGAGNDDAFPVGIHLRRFG